VPEPTAGRSALEAHYHEGEFGAVSSGEAHLSVCERRDLDLIQLDLREADEKGRAEAEKVIGFGLPVVPCLASRHEGKAALWTGPGRWLLTFPSGGGRESVAALSKRLEGRHHALIDLTQARTVIRVGGLSVRDLLSKGTPIDLHPRAFPVDSCAVTSLAHVTGLIHHVEDGVFDLYVFRSFGLHLWEWLREAGEEYGGVVGPPIGV
jgi:sarcosine oxidase subunit gamma